jgi:hypothetical protein
LITDVKVRFVGVEKVFLLDSSAVIDHCLSEQNAQVVTSKELAAFAHSKQPVEDPCLPRSFAVQVYCKRFHCHWRPLKDLPHGEFYSLKDH